MTQFTFCNGSAWPLCRREKSLTLRLDRGGTIRSIDVRRSTDDVCPIDRASPLARFHKMEDGRIVSGAEAFSAIWRAIPALGPLGLTAQHPVLLSMIERCYRSFPQMQPWLQRRLGGTAA